MDDLARINFQVDKQVKKDFKTKCASKGKKMREVLAKFINQYIKVG